MDKVIEIPGSAPMEVPLSHGRCYGDLIFTSGQVSKDLLTGKALPGMIEDETEQVLKNIKVVLEAAGSSLECVLKTTVFLTSHNDFARMNKVYEKFFPGVKPARSAIIIGLAGDYKIEIEVIAYKMK
jgi:2-iminobutanoate/2-iminopropanoate deaminase